MGLIRDNLEARQRHFVSALLMSSVQFKMVSTRSEKPIIIYALSRLSELSQALPLKQFQL